MTEFHSWKLVAGTILQGLKVGSVTNVSILFYDIINTTFLKPKRHFLMWRGEDQLRKQGWRIQKQRGRELGDKIPSGNAGHSGRSYKTVQSCPLIHIHQYIFNTWLQHTKEVQQEKLRRSLMACLAQGLTAEISWWSEIKSWCFFLILKINIYTYIHNWTVQFHYKALMPEDKY